MCQKGRHSRTVALPCWMITIEKLHCILPFLVLPIVTCLLLSCLGLRTLNRCNTSLDPVGREGTHLMQQRLMIPPIFFCHIRIIKPGGPSACIPYADKQEELQYQAPSQRQKHGLYLVNTQPLHAVGMYRTTEQERKGTQTNKSFENPSDTRAWE